MCKAIPRTIWPDSKILQVKSSYLCELNVPSSEGYFQKPDGCWFSILNMCKVFADISYLFNKRGLAIIITSLQSNKIYNNNLPSGIGRTELGHGRENAHWSTDDSRLHKFQAHPINLTEFTQTSRLDLWNCVVQPNDLRSSLAHVTDMLTLSLYVSLSPKRV